MSEIKIVMMSVLVTAAYMIMGMGVAKAEGEIRNIGKPIKGGVSLITTILWPLIIMCWGFGAGI